MCNQHDELKTTLMGCPDTVCHSSWTLKYRSVIEKIVDKQLRWYNVQTAKYHLKSLTSFISTRKNHIYPNVHHHHLVIVQKTIFGRYSNNTICFNIAPHIFFINMLTSFKQKKIRFIAHSRTKTYIIIQDIWKYRDI